MKKFQGIPLKPWIWWRRSRTCLKLGVASSYLEIWSLMAYHLKIKDPDMWAGFIFITILWGYMAYRGMKTFDHHTVTPVVGLLWLVWIALTIGFFLYTVSHKSPHFM